MHNDTQFLELLQPLVDKTLGGSPAALNHLIAFCFPNLKAQARRQIGREMTSEVAASDLAQMTCIKAAQNIHLFRGHTALRFWNWLRRIQRNQLVDLARKVKVNPTELNPNDLSSDNALPLIDSLPTPRTWAIKEETKDAVRKAVNELPVHYQDVIRMRWAESLTFTEIAEQLKMSSEDAARGCYNRAVEILRNKLREVYEY